MNNDPCPVCGDAVGRDEETECDWCGAHVHWSCTVDVEDGWLIVCHDCFLEHWCLDEEGDRA